MFVRNPNSNYTVETDEELSYVPLNTYAFDNNLEEDDIYNHNDSNDTRYLPPFLNNPLMDMMFGPPGGPGGPPGGHGGGPGGPPGPPPAMTPNKSGASLKSQGPGGPQTFAVSPGSIRPCRFQFVYIWLRNGNSFWAWLTNVDRRTASGFRWNGRRWVYFGIDLRRIDYFECYGRNNPRGFGNLFGPPMGPPSGGPSSGPGGNQGGPPGAPPSTTPKKPTSTQSQSLSSGPSVKAVSPGSIKPCLYQFVYIWLTNGRSFWAWLVSVDSRTASGFRWTGRTWTYFGVDLKSIEYFECYGRNYNKQRSDVKKNTLPNVNNMNNIPPLANGNTNTMGNLTNMQDLANIDYNVDVINMDTMNNEMAPMNVAPITNSAPPMNGAPVVNETKELESNIQNQTIAPTDFKVDYPVITGLENEEAEIKINDAIIGEVTSLLNNQVIVPEQKQINEVALSYQVPLKESGLLCIVFSIYVHIVGTPGNTIFSSCTFDTNTGEKIELEDLFIPSSNYKEVLSDIAMQKCEEDEVPFIADYEGVSDSQQFYLTPKGLVLFYQMHEYTPSSYGLFRIPIYFDQIVDILNSLTQVSNLVNNDYQV